MFKKPTTDKQKISEFLNSRYINTVFPSKEKATELLSSGRQLVFYLGIDPTGPDLHLGHITNFFILKELANLGHKVILLTGDFTAQTGDPTGKDATRKVLNDKEVKTNMKTYLEQVIKILPNGSFESRYNSKWLARLNFSDIRKLARLVTVQQVIARDMFQKRLASGKPITVEEFLYPLMQGYDSVAMEVDGEIGGTDQTFNMMVGRDLVRSLLNKDKIVITTKLLEDKETGKKLMSKSEGHYISLNDSPQNIFGKVMSMPDFSILPLFTLATEVSDKKITEVEDSLKNEGNPKNVKEMLAFELVKMCYGEKSAQKAKEEFNNVFGRHELPQEIEEILAAPDNKNIVDLIFNARIEDSRGEIKRLIEQKAVKVNDKVIEDWNEEINIGDDGALLKIGPRRFYKVKIKS